MTRASALIVAVAQAHNDAVTASVDAGDFT